MIRSWLIALSLLAAGCGARSALLELDSGPSSPDGGAARWALAAGGAGDDHLQAIAADEQGNVYIAGSFKDRASFGELELVAATQGFDAPFVAKLGPDGRFLWALGGEARGQASGLAVDAQGYLFVVGSISGTGRLGVQKMTSAGGFDLFVARISPQGQVLWLLPGGGKGKDTGHAVAVGGGGKVYVTGTCGGPASFGGHAVTGGGMGDVVIARLDAQGSWDWATAGNTALAPWPPPPGDKMQQSDPGDIAVTAAGEVFVAGSFMGQMAYAGSSVQSGGSYDLFVSGTSAGGKPLWLQAGGGPEVDQASGLVADGAGGVLVTGRFTRKLSLGGVTVDAQLDHKLFLARFEPGGQVSWARTHEGTKIVSAGVDLARGPVLLGSCAFGASLDGFKVCQGGSFFVARLDEQGQPVEVIDPGVAADARAVAADGQSRIYVAGQLETPLSLEGTSLVSQGQTDIFVWRAR